MTSPRRRQDSPIESVTLTVTFRTTKEQAAELREVVGSVSYKKGICEVRIDTDTTVDAVLRVKALLEKVRKFT